MTSGVGRVRRSADCFHKWILFEPIIMSDTRRSKDSWRKAKSESPKFISYQREVSQPRSSATRYDCCSSAKTRVQLPKKNEEFAGWKKSEFWRFKRDRHFQNGGQSKSDTSRFLQQWESLMIVRVIQWLSAMTDYSQQARMIVSSMIITGYDDCHQSNDCQQDMMFVNMVG